MYVRHSRIQHGVGQGSFHSATVEFRSTNGMHRFDYIYDCGALKYARQTPELQYALSRVSLERREAGWSKAVLDLLILSHFDSDHMNGAQDLVARFSVERIVLPYLGIDELALVIASQADVIDEPTILQLHGLASGNSTLWGRPVTMVQTGPRDNEENPFQADPPPWLRGDEHFEQPPAQDLPRGVSVILESTGASLDSVMSDEDNLIAGPAPLGVSDSWTLRFWNRGLDARLGSLIQASLARVGFPIQALSDKANGGQAIVAWLNIKPQRARAKKGKKATGSQNNRKLAVEAYREAIQQFAPTWLNEVSGRRLDNFLSLGLYSGPGFRFNDSELSCSELNSDYWYRSSRGHNQLAGWIGTGDAPLGETAIWQDFEAHYKNELPQTQTVVIPHHGAAPAGGTRFYNPGLNHRRGVNSVISCGSRNNHGHPHPSVLAGIFYADGRLVKVTEKNRFGFQENYLFNRS